MEIFPAKSMTQSQEKSVDADLGVSSKRGGCRLGSKDKPQVAHVEAKGRNSRRHEAQGFCGPTRAQRTQIGYK